MSGQAKLRFLPWIRTGAAGAIDSPDALTGALAANATLRPWVQITGHAAIEQVAMLRGPGHVTALGPQAVLRTEPVDGAQDFEPNFFPFVELRPADLPWRFTPASPGTHNQLRPWLVLVVVREQDGVSIVSESQAKLPVLRIEAPATASLELPDLADSAAWVHAQTSLAIEDVAAALDADPDAALARLICPRHLVPDARWLACLVPAFDVGVHAGLGEDAATQSTANPAWDLSTVDAGVVRLPVFHRWSFTTGPDGDFESLARRLVPDEGGTRLGRAGLDVTDPGAPLPPSPARAAVTADYVGALRSVGVTRRAIDAAHRKWLDQSLEPLVERGATRPSVPAAAPRDYDPARDDPVVAPPLYGALQTARRDVPGKADGRRGWMRPLNLMPEFRAIAGLGAAVVRANQEALMASAWSQAAALRETQRAVDQSLLAVEIGRAFSRRVAQWESGALVQATQRLHPWIGSPASSASLASDLRLTALPPALVSTGFARATRPRSAVSRAWTRRVADATPLAATTTTMLTATRATAPESSRRMLDFAKTALPVGAWTVDDALIADATAVLTAVPASRSTIQAHAVLGGAALQVRPVASLAEAISIEGEIGRALTGTIVAPAPTRAILDLSGAAAAIASSLDPLPAARAGLFARIPALATLGIATDALPRRLVLAPRFDDPLSRDLVRLDARWLVPGADALATNRVALLEADDDFLAAFLSGANHEMSRELIWREFPASPRATFFHRFWDTGATGPDDIADIATWSSPKLGGNLIGVTAGALAVVLVRGDVVRRYPQLRIRLTRGGWQGDEVLPDAAETREAILLGRLDRRTVFLGFDVSAQDMRGDRDARTHNKANAGWFVTFEEPSQGPRFGLDLPLADGSDLANGAASWADLTWGHLAPPRRSGDDVLFAIARRALPGRNAATHGRLTWGHNAAHMAAITWQRPFRLHIHADRLLPP